MSALLELYQEMILDHHKQPRNFRRLDEPKRTADGYNPLCGDQLSVSVRVEHDVITDIGFQGSGCAISTASASMMTESVKGKSVVEAEALFERVHSMLTEGEAISVDPAELGKLAVLSGVRAFPTRVKCATLAWHTLRAALTEQTAPVSTE
jgi:nitrogen fixation NifU-like protein